MKTFSVADYTGYLVLFTSSRHMHTNKHNSTTPTSVPNTKHNLPAGHNTAADWSFPGLSTSTLGARHFLVSKPGGGHARMALAHYWDYVCRQADEEPLYVFDGGFGETAPELLARYRVPAVFGQDYYRALGEWLGGWVGGCTVVGRGEGGWGVWEGVAWHGRVDG